jgi:hypothetical protein
VIDFGEVMRFLDKFIEYVVVFLEVENNSFPEIK